MNKDITTKLVQNFKSASITLKSSVRNGQFASTFEADLHKAILLMNVIQRDVIALHNGSLEEKTSGYTAVIEYAETLDYTMIPLVTRSIHTHTKLGSEFIPSDEKHWTFATVIVENIRGNSKTDEIIDDAHVVTYEDLNFITEFNGKCVAAGLNVQGFNFTTDYTYLNIYGSNHILNDGYVVGAIDPSAADLFYTEKSVLNAEVVENKQPELLSQVKTFDAELRSYFK